MASAGQSQSADQQGLYELRANNWQFKLTKRQRERIDELLLESDSVNEFFRQRCVADSQTEGMTVTDAHAAYSEFCFERGWNPVARQNFGKEAPEAVQQIFRASMRHDIKGADNRRQRGWKLRLRAADELSQTDSAVVFLCYPEGIGIQPD